MNLNNGNIKIHIDEKNGAVLKISDPCDESKMNWIADKPEWGTVENFEKQGCKITDDKISVLFKRNKLELTIERELTEIGYFETYSLFNNDDEEFFLTKENFGIVFPYRCNYTPQNDLINQTCVSHIWCGGSVCEIHSSKLHGKPPYFVCRLVKGEIDDYSISYDISEATIGSFYRGAFVLHPCEQIILPKKKLELKFFYSFCEKKPEKASLDFEGAIRFISDKYTLYPGEKAKFKLETSSSYENIKIHCDNEKFDYEKNGNIFTGSFSFEKIGEKKIIAELDGKKTYIYINVILPFREIFEKRVKFIAEKQQYHCEGSHIDGAYLIYDDETKSIYCNNSGSFDDHNAARERIGMGVLVCRALNLKYDEALMQSLKKHRKFVEREIFDEKTGWVYDGIKHNDNRKRIFNFPWLSTYYYEWYSLTGEKKCIENATNILFKFFELAEYSQPAQCIEAVKIYNALEKEKMTALKEKFKEIFLRYVDNIEKKQDIVLECSWCSEIPSAYVSYISQAYILTKDEKYRKKAEEAFFMLEAFWGNQPDYRLNCVPVRYWDRYWFGKYKSYGDVFPHYWASLAGWAMSFYNEAFPDSSHKKEEKANIYGNLCIFREDGFAYNNYLYPYKITLYTSDPDYENEHLKPQITYGKNYDPWANDQDWALYFASYILD